ncbi:MAG: hypothetical protein WAS33_17305 [Candidatus Promineifilaceae bacterium]
MAARPEAGPQPDEVLRLPKTALEQGAAEPCLIFTESLNYCHQHKSLRINAFVIMPTHAHVMLFDADFDNERLNNTVTAMRQFTGRQLAN